MSFFYLATPYTKYKDGLDAAFHLACDQAGRFVAARLPVYSPVAHTHPIAIASGLDPKNHDIWLPADKPFMDAAHGLIVVEADGWKESYGVEQEIAEFRRWGKPIINMKPNELPWEELARIAWMPLTN